MHPPPPLDVVDLIAEERMALLALLDDLRPDEWRLPTACAGWSVHDLALHMLGDDLGVLSRGADAYQALAPAPEEPFVAFIDRINAEWLTAARRLSPRLTRDLLAFTGPRLVDYLRSLDPHALEADVSWAGPGPHPNWLELARTYTEYWHHAQHIRDAVGRPGQTSPRFLGPVLATFVHALPVAFAAVGAPIGTVVELTIEGDAGGSWSVRREPDGWRLYAGTADAPAARVALPQDAAWRLFTKGLAPEEAERHARSEGDARLAQQALRAVAIIG
jgi:uncharacterized protein (TIGR03083 family)